MNKAIAILDENSLRDVGSVEEFIHKRSAADILSFVEGLRQAVVEEAQANFPAQGSSSINQANYLPSSSFRGGSGCIHWNCRIPKIRSLARYAALYCDKTIVPLSLRCEEEDQKSQWLDRIRLGGSLCALVELRPLIESGLVLAVPEELQFCKTHLKEAVPDFERILDTADRLASLRSNKFKVFLSTSKVGSAHVSRLDLIGPEEYLAHGSGGWVLDAVPKWLPKHTLGRRTRIGLSSVRKYSLLGHIFRTMANDALLQTYFGTAFNARYVTDLPGEAEFFQMLNADDTLALQTAALCARLAHSIPLLDEVPLETVMKVRRDDALAFDNYRSALTGIVKTYVREGRKVGNKEAIEIYEDILKPRLVALETQARNLRRTALKKGLLKAAASSILVGLGIYTGVLPSDVTKLVTAIGGFSVAKDLAEALGTLEANPGEVRNHNLYFLLRLKQSL
jgi:hypothetical protein